MNARSAQHAGARQLGFTLVELLVVMVIGLILLLGVVTLLRQLHHQFRAQTGIARLNDDARFVFETMREAIQGAGGTNPADLQPVNPINGDAVDNALNATTLSVTYYAPHGCLGGSDAGSHTVTYSRDGAQLMRVCDGDSEPLIGDDNPNADYATAVDNLQFSYAIDENADQSIDCWWPPAQGTQGNAAATCPPSGKATPDLADVIGVRVTLDLSARNPTPDQPNKNEQQQDYIRRQYVMTFAIDSKLGFFVPNQ